MLRQLGAKLGPSEVLTEPGAIYDGVAFLEEGQKESLTAVHLIQLWNSLDDIRKVSVRTITVLTDILRPMKLMDYS